MTGSRREGRWGGEGIRMFYRRGRRIKRMSAAAREDLAGGETLLKATVEPCSTRWSRRSNPSLSRRSKARRSQAERLPRGSGRGPHRGSRQARRRACEAGRPCSGRATEACRSRRGPRGSHPRSACARRRGGEMSMTWRRMSASSSSSSVARNGQRRGFWMKPTVSVSRTVSPPGS